MFTYKLQIKMNIYTYIIYIWTAMESHEIKKDIQDILNINSIIRHKTILYLFDEICEIVLASQGDD